MELILKNGKSVSVREYRQGDFINIQRLNINEGWTNLVEKKMIQSKHGTIRILHLL